MRGKQSTVSPSASTQRAATLFVCCEHQDHLSDMDTSDFYREHGMHLDVTALAGALQYLELAIAVGLEQRIEEDAVNADFLGAVLVALLGAEPDREHFAFFSFPLILRRIDPSAFRCGTVPAALSEPNRSTCLSYFSTSARVPA